MTYQRNIYEPSARLRACALTSLVEDEVPERQVDAREEAEDDHDGGRLRDLVAVGPLDPAQLRPDLDEEGEHAAAPARLAFARRWLGRASSRLAARLLGRTFLLAGSALAAVLLGARSVRARSAPRRWSRPRRRGDLLRRPTSRPPRRRRPRRPGLLELGAASSCACSTSATASGRRSLRRSERLAASSPACAPARGASPCAASPSGGYVPSAVFRAQRVSL